MGVSPSSNDSEIDTLSIVRLCRFYHEDFKVVMPVCTQQSREEELNVGIMSKRTSWARDERFCFFFFRGRGGEASVPCTLSHVQLFVIP